MWPFKQNKSKSIQQKVINQPDIAKQPEKPEQVIIKKDRFDITIILGCGKELGYNQIHEYNSGKNCIGCFLSFYRWFYEKKSPYYTFEHNAGADIFVRSEIKSIIMRKTEIEDVASTAST